MLLGGDEIGRTQQGNNNAYCQDNELSWYNWENVDKELHDFCRKLIQYRKDHPVFRRRGWFHGRSIHGSDVDDIRWFTMEGEQMAERNWGQGVTKSLGVFLNGATIPNPNPRGEPVIDDNFYLIFNAFHDALQFKLPGPDYGNLWIKEIDTETGWQEEPPTLKAGDAIMVAARCLVVLRHEI
jgi:glycogen operon protein